MKNWLKQNWIIVIITIVCLGGLIYIASERRHRTIYEIIEKDSVKALSFKDSVLNYIYDMRLEHPYIVFAQAIIETGNFTSDIMKQNNNLFGMKLPERRVTLALGVKNGHAVYSNWRESVIDYAFFQITYMRGLTEEEYFEKLRQSYASDEYYVNKIRSLKSSLVK